MTSVFSFPTTIVFGPGTVQELGKRLAAMNVRRPLIVTDPGLMPTSAFKATVASLRAMRPVTPGTA